MTWVVKCEKLNFRKSLGIYIRQAPKTVHEWNVHPEIFSDPQAKENYGQYLLLRTDILEKTVAGCR